MSTNARGGLGVAVTVAAFVVVSAGLAAWRRRTAAGPEVTRKLLHVAMGCVALSFPWLFARGHPGPVLAMSGAFVVLFVVRRVVAVPGLGRGVSDVLDGVDRSSWGELYFTISAATLFAVSGGDPIPYCIPILLLALPDAVAALVGMRYGVHRYGPAGGEKTAEGSIAFFAVAFMAVHVPLLLFTRTGRAETLLIAATLALLATLLEGIAWRGLDNLLVPLGAFVLLNAFVEMDVRTLAGRLALASGCTIFGILWRRRTTLDGGAVLGAALVGYLAWALGDWQWLLPPLTVFVSYTFLWPKTDRERRVAGDAPSDHNAYAVASVAAAGLFWLFAARVTGWQALFYFPYTLSFAVHLALIGVGRVRRRYPAMTPFRVLATSALAGWALVFLPFVAVRGVDPSATLCAVAALPIVAATCAGFYTTQPAIHDCPADFPRWLRQGAYAAASSLIGLLVIGARL